MANPESVYSKIGVKVGDIYIGAVNKERFTVEFIGKRHPYTAKEKPEVKLFCSKALRWANLDYIQYMIKSGGLLVESPS